MSSNMNEKNRKHKKYAPKVLDLFAGAGGFSEGFIFAGCEMVAHVEMDKDACDTIKTRMVYHALQKMGNLEEYKKYLLGEVPIAELVKKYNLQKEIDSVIHTKIDQDNYKQLIASVKKKLAGSRLDIIIGGPPCQAYSHIGRSSDKKHMEGDERKFLYKYYIEFLKALKPKVFVFENVPGLLSDRKGYYLKTMREEMKEAGYNTDYKILNASDFGVPQSRRRVVLIGWSEDAHLKSYPVFEKVSREYRVNEFLGDLPTLQAGEGVSVTKYHAKSPLLQHLGITNPEIKLLIGHISRPQSKQDLHIYRIAVKKKNEGRNLRYSELPRKLKTHKNQTGFSDRFKVVDSSALASHTVIAHISKDGHYYIHPDIEQNRSLTVREASRLQTFPDDFKFEGSRTAQFKQIGNAVPPLLSKVIAKKIVDNL